MRNAARHGAHGLHLVRFAQLRFQLTAVRLGFLAAGEVAGKHGGGFALGMALERHAHLHRQLFGAGRAGRHFAQHGLGGELRKRQRLPRRGQKTLQRAAQCVLRAALEQRRCRGVEHGDEAVLVHADDGVERGVDDGFQPLLAGVQLLVALLQCLRALLQRVALGQQGALVDHRAQKLQLHGAVTLVVFNAGDVQVAGDADVWRDGEHHLGHLAVPLGARLRKGLLHAGGVGV